MTGKTGISVSLVAPVSLVSLVTPVTLVTLVTLVPHKKKNYRAPYGAR